MSSGKTRCQIQKCLSVPVYPASSPCSCRHSFAGRAMWHACPTTGFPNNFSLGSWWMESALEVPRRSASRTASKHPSRPSTSALTHGKFLRRTEAVGAPQSKREPKTARPTEPLPQYNDDRLGRTAQTAHRPLPPSPVHTARELFVRRLA